MFADARRFPGPYAYQRYYNSGMGRFWSPDPGGIKTAVPSDPSSWNRYAYTEGDPVNFIDPDGTNLVYVGTACVGDEVLVCSMGYVLTGPSTMENPDGGAPEGGGGRAKGLSITNFSTSGNLAAAVQNTLYALFTDLSEGNDPDSDCTNWLEGSSSTESFLSQLSILANTPSTVGVGTFSDNTVNAVAGSPPSTGIPAGTEITVNVNGAYFNSGSSSSVGYGVPSWITGGSPAAQMLLVIHELAHDFAAPGFNANDNGNSAAQTANNNLVMQKCGSVISWWAGQNQ